MTIDIRDKKFSLIERILRIDDNIILEKIEQELNKISEPITPQIPDINEAVRPIRSNVTLTEIKREQNYQPISYDEFRVLANEVGMEEPIEDLLAMLTK